MTYTKIWELIHLLGGACHDCGEANFTKLQIDPIYPDYNTQKRFYKTSQKDMLDNPERTKKRFIILCDDCIERKYTEYQTPLIVTNDDFLIKARKFMTILKKLEGTDKAPVSNVKLESILIMDGFTSDEIRKYKRRLLREASIYESLPNHYNIV